MRFAICLAPIGDTYGQHHHYVERLTASLSQRSIQAEILRYPGEAFFPKLFENLSDPDTIVHFHTFFFELLMSDAGLATELANPLDNCQAIPVATIADHPFAHFMQFQMGRAHPKTRFLVIDDSFIEEMHIINPKLRASSFQHFPSFPTYRGDRPGPLSWKEREYDVVIPMNILDRAGGDITRFLKVIAADPAAGDVTATYETVMGDPAHNPFTVFRRIYRERTGMDMAEVHEKDPALFQLLLNMISVTDNIIRQARRNRMLSSLLRSTGDLRVAVISNRMPWLDVSPHVTFTGLQPFRTVAELVANSRAVVNCSPTYPNSIHERIHSAMASGAAVITDENPQLRRTFIRDQYVPYNRESTMPLSEIFENFDLEKIAAAGTHQIANESAFSWDFHIERLVAFASR